MGSEKTTLYRILDKLDGLPDITWRMMMGEFILYHRGRIFGGIYDNRLLVKPVAAAHAHLSDAPLEAPYLGAKPMLRVDDAISSDALQALVQAMYPELPAPKAKKEKK